MTLRTLIGALTCTVLCACSPSSATSPSTDAAQQAPSPGLIENPQFTSRENGSIAPPWSDFQHAGVHSYTYTSTDGVLTITRIDEQVWGHLSQRIRGATLQGKTVEFSADLAGTLDSQYGEPMGPTGLMVTVHGKRADQPRSMLGLGILSTHASEPGMAVGENDWRRYSVRFKVPPVEEANSIELEVALALTLGGALKVRNPSLQVVSSD
ncbi:MAG: hypothetical protein V4812_02775 [Pseudomonadota bacterium]